MKNLRVLITTHHLIEYAGSELFTYTLAKYLVKNNVDVTLYSKYLGKTSSLIEKLNIRVVDNLQEIKSSKFDVAHVQHYINFFEVKESFPNLPIVYVSHGVIPALEQPPPDHFGVDFYVAITERVKKNLELRGIAPNKIKIIRNIFDAEMFSSACEINASPKSALIISNHMPDKNFRIIEESCKQLNIRISKVGLPNHATPYTKLPEMINSSDIVFTIGRGVIETCLCERVPIIYDYLGGDGMLTPSTFEMLMSMNFTGLVKNIEFTTETLVNEINKYKPNLGHLLRQSALRYFDPDQVCKEYINIYSLAIQKRKTGTATYVDDDIMFEVRRNSELYQQIRNYESVKLNRALGSHIDAQAQKIEAQASQINDQIQQIKTQAQKIKTQAQQIKTQERIMNLRDAVSIARSEVSHLQTDLQKIQSAKFYKLWQKYNQVKRIVKK